MVLLPCDDTSVYFSIQWMLSNLPKWFCNFSSKVPVYRPGMYSGVLVIQVKLLLCLRLLRMW